MKARCLIIDDERLARQHLRRLAERRHDIEVAGEASSKEGALRAIEKTRPDLLFLDVQMPEGDGFDLLNAIENPPATIFVTAFDQYAVRAFEVNALDYLMKPVDPGRFDKTVDRALQRTTEARGAGPTGPLADSDLALIEVGGSGHFVSVRQILFIESEGNYTRLTTADGKHLLARQPMKDWIRRLPGEFFVQLDRGLAINRGAIRSATYSGRCAQVLLGDRALALELGATASGRLRAILPG